MTTLQANVDTSLSSVRQGRVSFIVHLIPIPNFHSNTGREEGNSLKT